MILRFYRRASEFLNKTLNCLLLDEAANNLMLGIALRIKDFPESTKIPPYLATVEKDGALTLAALMTPPENLLLFSPKKPCLEAYEAIAQDLLDRKMKFPGVFAAADLSENFAKVWKRKTGMVSHINSRQRVYRLDKVIWPEQMQGSLREATEEDLPLLEEWMYAFLYETFGRGNRDEVHETVRSVLPTHSLHVWVDGGKPVCMAGGRRPTPHAIVIAWVYTPPEFRRHGYAGACVANLSQYYLDSGKEFCSLFTDVTNPTSNEIYQKIGYKSVCDFTGVVFEA
jgi:uncharacterized protein